MTDKAPRKTLGCGQAVLICAAALGIALYAIWPSDKEMAAQRDAALTGAAQVSATADEFAAAFATNEVAAGERFRDKAITLTGTVQSVQESNSDDMVLIFATKSGAPLHTSIDAEDRTAVAGIRPGQVASIHCARLLEVLGARVPSQCRLKSLDGKAI